MSAAPQGRDGERLDPRDTLGARHVLVVSPERVIPSGLRELLGVTLDSDLVIDHLEDLGQAPDVLGEAAHDVLVLDMRLDPHAIARLVAAAARASSHPPIVLLPARHELAPAPGSGRRPRGPERPPGDLVEEVFRHALETTVTRRALHAAEVRFATLAEVCAQGVLLVDGEGRVRLFNPAAERLLGTRAVERIGLDANRALPELRHIDGRPFADDVHPLRLARWRTWAFVESQVLVRRPDGTDARLLLRAQRLAGAEAGTGRMLLVVLSGASEAMVLPAPAAGAPPAAGGARPAGSVAHDLNNLLHAIQGYAELMALGMPSHHPAHAHLEPLHDAVDRATALVRALRSTPDQAALRPGPLDLDHWISSRRPLLEHLLGPGIRLELDLTLGATVWLDAQALEQAVMNLAMNARDAMERGGTLRIATASVRIDEAAAGALPGGRPGCFVRLTVEDDGSGMDEDTRRRAFEPRFTTKPAERGSGLGLAVVRDFVERSGGFVTLDSAPGAGSRFDLHLQRVPG